MLLLPHALGLTVSADGWSTGNAVAILWLSATVMALACGGAFSCHWWISQNRASAWIATILIALSIQQLPPLLLELDSSTAAALRTTNPELDSALALPCVLLLGLSNRSFLFRHRVSPIVVGIALGLFLGSVRFSYTALDLQTVAAIPEMSATAGRVVALLMGAAAILAVMRVTALPVWARQEMVVAAAAVSVGWIDRLGRVGPPDPGDIVAGSVHLAGYVVLGITATELFLIALRDNDRRLASLATRAESAEEALRHEEERLHEMRGTFAGIGSASRILTGLGDELSSAHQRRLTELLATEIDRLDAMLGGAHGEPPAVVELDPVIRSTVCTYRYLGLRVRSEPSDASAWTRPADLTEVLHILLSNVARHAPGAETRVITQVRDDRTEIRVIDDGPGIAPALRDHVFERGFGDGKGQGLGLYVARQILAQHGGSLDLDTTPRGTSFVLRLPARELS